MDRAIYTYEKKLILGTLHRRYKRFLADVELPGADICTVHCPNSGSMLNMVPPYVDNPPCFVSVSDNPKNKYQHGLEMILINSAWVGVHSALANKMVKNALEMGLIAECTGFTTLNQEVKIDDSRIDFELTFAPEIGEGKNASGSKKRRRSGTAPQAVSNSQRMLVEVKSVTLTYAERPSVAEFPDSVSARATKHINLLKNHVICGGRAAVLFLIQRSDVESFSPCGIDKTYQQALHDAHEAGVLVLPYKCELCPESKTVLLIGKIPFVDPIISKTSTK